MNDITPNPDQNTHQSVPTPNHSPDPVNPIQPNKSSKKPILIIAVIIVVAAVALAAVVLTKKSSPDNNQTTSSSQNTVSESSQPKTIEQTFISPVNGAKTDISKNDYYVATAGESQYYGLVSKINTDYIRMTPMAYKKSGTLVFSGTELHGPESVTYFQVSKVTNLQKLDPANKDEAAIMNALKAKNPETSDPFPEQNINKYIRTGQFQAYFFADGTTFYAKTSTLDSTFLASSSHVYILREVPQVNPTGPAFTGIGLVLAKPEQYNKRTASELLYWQNMKSDSQITKAATLFEKQNP